MNGSSDVANQRLANSTINAKVGSSTDHDWFRFSK